MFCRSRTSLFLLDRFVFFPFSPTLKESKVVVKNQFRVLTEMSVLMSPEPKKVKKTVCLNFTNIVDAVV